jgi:hypothetical protein
LSALIEFVQARIEALVAPAAAPGLHGFLSPVPEPEQPELPIPRPGASAQRGIALVHAISQPADSEPAARPAPDPFVLSLDPRVGPVFGQQAGDVRPAPPRSPNVIPEIDFIDSLFDQIDAKAARQAAADEAAAVLALSAPPVAAAVETVLAPPPSAIVLPPVDMPSIEMALPAATAPAEATADIGEAAQAVAFGELIDLTETVTDTEANAATSARADALVRATNATADAIDNIVAAAAEAMAEAAMAEAAAAVIAEPPIAEIAFGEAGLAETGPVEAGLPEVGFVEAGVVEAPAAEAELADVATAEAEASIAPAIGDVTPVAPVAIADPAQHVWDNALAAIMALSEEERLALFT